MTIRLLIRVSRGKDGRLGGEVVPVGSDTPHGFSGTLELLKVLEDLVMPDGDDDVPTEFPDSPDGGRRITPIARGPQGPDVP